jgi:DsbC/DsbD-like thiol-disulfide interchange protein
MKRTSTVAIAILVALAIEACQKNSPQPVQSQATPAEVSSTAEVVKVVGHFVPKAAGAPANVELEITPGFHVNANPATFPYLIATQVLPGKVEGITVGQIAYPAGVPKKFAFADQPLSVYEGKVTIPISLTAGPDAKGERTLPLKLRVQACDSEKCLPPSTLDAAIAINLDALRP